jgi:hypothetical protein
VLCILTFIGSGYSLFSSLITISYAGKFEQLNQQTIQKHVKSESKESNGAFAQKMMKDSMEMLKKENIYKLNGATIFSNLLTLAGALLMFRMDKRGFWLYLVGIIFWIALPLIIFGVHSITGIITAVSQGVIGVSFVVMYAFNLKDMNPVPVETGLL